MAKRSKRRDKAYVPAVGAPGSPERGWMNVWSSYSPWQVTQGFQLDLDTSPRRMQSNWAVFACQTLIAGDIAKLRMTLVERKKDGGPWLETSSPAYDRLFLKPNGFQIWSQFIECWSLSKQRRGNTYVLLDRDLSTRVRAMYVLDPDRVTPLIADDGSVYYRLSADDIASVHEEIVVPASEIIHDRFNGFFHPLVGLSPLYASALAAGMGTIMQEESFRFFRNGARPSGILTAPQAIPDDLAKQYKERWETHYSGANAGRTAVLGSGLTYTPLTRDNAVDSEFTAQLKLSAEMVCSAHHVPGWKIGAGTRPTYQNAEIESQAYYTDCLQKLIESIECLLDAALDLGNVDGRKLRAQFDLKGLLRMDSAAQVESLNKAVGGGWMSVNEARAERGLAPVAGGESPRMQQQVFSLEALAERDRNDPFAKPAAPTAAPPATPSKGAEVVLLFQRALKEKAKDIVIVRERAA